MHQKKLDNRLRIMIENGVALGHRSMFVIVGEKGRDQVYYLHHMLNKARYKARPNVLWCYKKDLGFTSNRKKRMKQLNKKIKTGTMDVNQDDPFEEFIVSTDIRYCYYNETHKILGQTYGMCVLQDFESFTPNLLARTVETVEGGGVIVILLSSLTSLKQLYTMSMDVHKRYRTEAHNDVVGRFNERFILSLANCKCCLVIDDKLNIIPLSTNSLALTAVPPKSSEDPLSEEEQELKDLKESLQGTQPVGVLVNLCRTLDQAKGLLVFMNSVTEKTLRNTVSLTAARGRGKSAALGLAIAGAVAFGYSNIFVTSPSPENLKTLFEFIFNGFDVLEYKEHESYEIIRSSNPEFNKAVIRVNILQNHRQTIQYIHPSDALKLGQAELVIIDEAAAIPLPLVKSLLGPYLVFMASTINGYEGTGRSLSLKLLEQLRQQTTVAVAAKSKSSDSNSQVSTSGRILNEIELNESIRYKSGDPVEAWLNSLLCLDATVVPYLSSGCPLPEDCELYYINRDTLFSYHRASEAFLQRIMSLYVSSHYKNSPNDLQMMSDAPAHILFCLLGPMSPKRAVLPEVMCVLQVCLEGEISKASILESLSRGKRASGDLLPWTIAQQFSDSDFPRLSGARVIRIATHPNYLRMGYGKRAIELLQQYYEGKIPMVDANEDDFSTKEPVKNESSSLLTESIAPRTGLQPLLLKLSERRAEDLDYLGVSYGLTSDLFKFWKKHCGFVPVYVRQTENDLTGEYTCIMLKAINSLDNGWLNEFWRDFRGRFVENLGFKAFRSFSPTLALSILSNDNDKITEDGSPFSKEMLQLFLSNQDLKRLEQYANNLVDYHLIIDRIPNIARLWFKRKMLGLEFKPLQACILAGIGLQFKSVDDLAKEIDLPAKQLLGIFNKMVKKLSAYLNNIMEEAISKTMPLAKEVTLEPTLMSLDEDLMDGAKQMEKQQKKEKKVLIDDDLSKYAIKGSEDDWHKVLNTTGKKSLVSLKSEKKRTLDNAELGNLNEGKMNKSKKKHLKKK